MKTKITISAILLTLISCNAHWQADYNRFQSQFSPEVFESFSELNMMESSQVSVDFMGAYEYVGYSRLNVLYEYADKESFAKALNDIEEKVIMTYNSFDTCLVSVYRMEDTIYNCGRNYFPVYNEFDNPYVSTAQNVPHNKEILSDTLQYNVFDCKEGWYIKDDNLKNLIGNRTEYLRKKTFEHGFSNGAIVDRKKMKIVYWVFVW